MSPRRRSFQAHVVFQIIFPNGDPRRCVPPFNRVMRQRNDPDHIVSRPGGIIPRDAVLFQHARDQPIAHEQSVVGEQDSFVVALPGVDDRFVLFCQPAGPSIQNDPLTPPCSDLRLRSPTADFGPDAARGATCLIHFISGHQGGKRNPFPASPANGSLEISAIVTYSSSAVTCGRARWASEEGPESCQ